MNKQHLKRGAIGIGTIGIILFAVLSYGKYAQENSVIGDNVKLEPIERVLTVPSESTDEGATIELSKPKDDG